MTRLDLGLQLLLVTSAAVLAWHVIREAFNRRKP